MGILFSRGSGGKLSWLPNAYTESAAYLANRERGFYNMRGVRISDGDPVTEETLGSIRRDRAKETLELLQIHIGSYRDREVSASGISQIQSVLEAYQSRDMDLIIRFVYDWDGKGAESDPSSLSVVLRHMEQMGGLLEAFQDQVYMVQGVFVGSWGEMHGSRYLSETDYLTLIRKMHEVMPTSVYLAVRTPAYWRAAAGTAQPLSGENAWDMSALPSRLSLFNDGILGNWLDCGTYGDTAKEDAQKLSDKWTRQDELDFQNRLNLYVPNGGEVVLENSLNDLESADEAFRTMHISYLNRGHDLAVLEKWENTVFHEAGSVYDGMSGYDYIERRLGYRFVIRQVSAEESGWFKKEPRITVSVENTGYACRYTPCRVEIILQKEEDGSTQILTAQTDVREWQPGKTVVFSVDPELKEAGEYSVCLRVTGEKTGDAVLFANETITDESGNCFLGTIRKGE